MTFRLITDRFMAGRSAERRVAVALKLNPRSKTTTPAFLVLVPVEFLPRLAWSTGDRLQLLLGEGEDRGLVQIAKSDQSTIAVVPKSHNKLVIINFGYISAFRLEETKRMRVEVEYPDEGGILQCRLPEEIFAAEEEEPKAEQKQEPEPKAEKPAQGAPRAPKAAPLQVLPQRRAISSALAADYTQALPEFTNVSGVRVDVASGEVEHDTRAFRFSPKQVRIIAALAKIPPGSYLERRHIAPKVWTKPPASYEEMIAVELEPLNVGLAKLGLAINSARGIGLILARK